MSPVLRRMQWIGAAALLVVGIASQAEVPPAASAAPAAVAPVATSGTTSDGISLATASAAAVSEPSAPNAWGGERTGSEATLSDRVVDYVIKAVLDPVKHTVDGHEQLTWHNRSDREVRSVYLHLYLNGFEGSGSTFFTEKRELGFGFRSEVPVEDGEWGHIALTSVAQNGAKVAWSFVHPDNGPASDHTVVRFDLPTPVPAGGSTTLDIGFQDQLPRVVARTGYFGSFHLVGQWFPKIGVLELPGERGATEPRWNVHEFHLHSEFYADFGSYDVSITVPKGYTVGATGEETGAPVEAGGKVTHRFVQGDVHDFAWTADNRTAPPLEGTWTHPGSPTVKVRVLFPPEYAFDAAPALKATTDALTYFSDTLGAYPYKTVTVVIPPYNAGEAGGMEYPTFFTADNVADPAPGTLGQYILDFVTIHEFGHGYFYGLLGSNEFEEPMLDEGLNEYWDDRMFRERKQPMYLATSWMKKLGLGTAMDLFTEEALGSSRNEPADGIGFNSWDRYSSGSYGTVYSRTATTMRDLEQKLGKATTERAFKEYYRRWHFRHPSAADLRETLAEVSGQRALVEQVFAQQVFAATPVNDRIDKFSSDEELPQPGTNAVNGRWVEQTQEQVEKSISDQREAWTKAHPKAGKDAPGPFPWRTTVTVRRSGAAVPQVLVVTFADGSHETVKFSDGQRWQRFSWVTPVKAVSVELDPNRDHYLDANMVDNSNTIKPDSQASRRWSLDIAAFLQTLYSLLVTA